MAVAAAGSVPSMAAERPTGGISAGGAAAIRESGGVVAVLDQDALSDFRAWMFKQPGFSASGYVGTIDGLADKGMTVMWYGQSTPLLTSIIAEAANRGITVSVQPSKYSLQQLTAASQMVFEQAAAGEWAGFKVEAVEALSTADSGLIIDGAYTSVPSARRASQVRSLDTTVDGVPAQIVPGRLAVLTSGRDDDFAPFYGGGFMATYTGPSSDLQEQACSTGFSITIGSNHYATTARHCIIEFQGIDVYGDYVARQWLGGSAPSQNVYGDGSGYYSEDGGGTILTSLGSNYVFRGSYTTDTGAAVEKLSNVGLNDLVCTEGGNSGGHCNIKVTNMLVMDNDSDGMFETIRGDQQTSGAFANMAGDSGGPVIVNLPDGNVGAAGMIQAEVGTIKTGSATGSACRPAYDYIGVSCGTGVLFSSMTTILNNFPYGWSLYTAS